MKQEEINALINKQRTYFLTGETLSVSTRIKALKRLQKAIQDHEQEIHEALKQDLGKSQFESYMCEVGLTLDEIRYMIKKTPRFAKKKRVRTPLSQAVSSSYTLPSPYGVTLIMSPWNYPFMLTMDPLADAIAAGNTVIVKPSAYSPHTSKIIETIIHECFDEKYVAVVTGGRQENQALFTSHFDKIFFTGSQSVGKEVMRHAAEYLTPVTLELGGKSPCIVDKTAQIKIAAKRIVFGKFLNCGQTCVAPDYILCDASIKDELIKELIKEIKTQFGEQPLNNPNYGKIINNKHFERLSHLIDESKLVHGGNCKAETLQIEPTILDHISWDDPIMQEEIFGPLLPILTFDSMETTIKQLQQLPHPLAFYIFSSNKQTIKELQTRCQFGGGCVNDTIIHLATHEMGFGGVGSSGMGTYHGKVGFEEFSHRKSIVDKKTWLDLPMRYQPYRSLNEKLVRLFLR